MAHAASPPAPLASGFVTSSYQMTGDAALQLHRWTLTRRAEAGSRLQLIVAVMPRPKTRMKVVPVSRLGAGQRLFVGLPCPKGGALVNGSFYIRDAAGERPLGLVRTGGRTTSAPSGRKYGGFLTSQAGTVTVLPRDERALALRADEAIESSPLVLEKGQLGIRSDGGPRFDRVSVGATPTQVVIVGVFGTDQDTATMGEFARLAQAALSRAGVGAADLLAMDGGPSAHIYLPATAEFFGSRGATYLPNAVCLSAR